MKVTQEAGNIDQEMQIKRETFHGIDHRKHGHHGHNRHHGHQGHQGHHGHHGHHGMRFGRHPPWMTPNPYMLQDISYNNHMWTPYYRQWGGRMAYGDYGPYGGSRCGGPLHGGPFPGHGQPGGHFLRTDLFGSRHGPMAGCRRGHRWHRSEKDNDESESHTSSSSDDGEDGIEVTGAEYAPVAEDAAMETKGDDQAKDCAENGKAEKCDKTKKKEGKKYDRPPGLGPRVMAVYLAGCMGLPLPLSPPKRNSKCGGKMKGHDHHGECRKMKMQRILKQMQKQEAFHEPSMCSSGKPFGGPRYGPSRFGSGPHRMDPHGMGHPAFRPPGYIPGGPARLDGMGPWGKAGRGCRRKLIRRQIVREACCQIMERKLAEHQQRFTEGKDCCQIKTQEKSDGCPSEQDTNVAGPSSDKAESGNNDNDSSDIENKPWDRWAAWQQSLQQIRREDIEHDKLENSDGNHPPLHPMQGFQWGFRRQQHWQRINRINQEFASPCRKNNEEAETNKRAPVELASAVTNEQPSQPAPEEN